jgi:phosphoribosylanthranilate isomerase
MSNSAPERMNAEFDELVQVAGVIDQAEADMLVQSGVRYLGFPLRLAVHREDLSDVAASSIIRGLEPPARGVLITYLDKADDILDLCDSLGASVVQLHGEIDACELRKVREKHPRLAIIKSLVIGQHPTERLLEVVERTAALVDAYITDTYDPRTGATGATGKTHDWRVSSELATRSPRPVILAGGLHPGNVRAAILEVRPAGVDAHTGLEDASGRKSEEKVRKFVAEARAAFRMIREPS